MRILIAGGTGFIGSHLTHYLLQKQHEVTILGRDLNKIIHQFGDQVSAMTWQQLDLNIIRQYDVIINLAGENIGARKWSKERKALILSSRIQPARILCDLCTLLGDNAPRLLNASAIGVYGLQQSCKDGLPPSLDEKNLIDFSQAPDFLSLVGRQWEKATFAARDAGCHVVNMRFGIVLDPSGGALKQLLLPYKAGLGGVIGNGQQPFCWIALEDLISAIDFIIQHPDLSGPINLTAPHTVSQRHFAKSLGKALHRPTLFYTPAFLLKFLLGDMAEELLLKGQHVVPNLLLKNGFKFQYETIDQYFSHAF